MHSRSQRGLILFQDIYWTVWHRSILTEHAQNRAFVVTPAFQQPHYETNAAEQPRLHPLLLFGDQHPVALNEYLPTHNHWCATCAYRLKSSCNWRNDSI